MNLDGFGRVALAVEVALDGVRVLGEMLSKLRVRTLEKKMER
jgi:hypothetical protein